MADSRYDKFLIESGEYWDVYVSEMGLNNLGRIYFWLKRNGIVDTRHLTKPEKEELFALQERFAIALEALFAPDLLNFAYLANHEGHGHHCHWHLVPRYKQPREFANITFVDFAWGSQWQSARLSNEVTLIVGAAIARIV